MKWKGIILAGGTGQRMLPLTVSISKQLLPIYDKPMIYYPLSVLFLAKIRDIMIITNREQKEAFTALLGTGQKFGVSFEYKIQDQPEGIAQAPVIAEDFIGKDHLCLIVGDNIFYGQGFVDELKVAMQRSTGASVFGYPVKDPERFGVVEIDENYKAISLEEKPKSPRSRYAVTGLYFYDNKVVEISKNLKKSERGELEVTDINRVYLELNELQVNLLGRGFAWLDTGTPESLIEASQFVQTIEHRQGLKIACLEEIAYRNGWIDSQQLLKIGQSMSETSYGHYILNLAKGEHVKPL